MNAAIIPIAVMLARMKNAIVDWTRVDTVLLDMDGTVLDLHFDTHFWTDHLPLRYAQSRRMSIQAARAELAPIFTANEGRLDWYCTDFWARTTGLDVIALKRELVDLIGLLPGALGFLDAMDAAHLPVWVATNAHPDVVALKMKQTGLQARFAGVVTAHEMGHAKEESGFWPALANRIGFAAERSLFVDDSPAVVAAAAAYGIGQVVALSHPDSRGSVREHAHSAVVPSLAVLQGPG